MAGLLASYALPTHPHCAYDLRCSVSAYPRDNLVHLLERFQKLSDESSRVSPSKTIVIHQEVVLIPPSWISRFLFYLFIFIALILVFAPRLLKMEDMLTMVTHNPANVIHQQHSPLIYAFRLVHGDAITDRIESFPNGFILKFT